MDLWMPEDIRDVLAVGAGVYESGLEITTEQMLDANIQLTEWIAGKVDNETYFDALAQCGIDPIQHIEPIFEYYGLLS